LGKRLEGERGPLNLSQYGERNHTQGYQLHDVLYIVREKMRRSRKRRRWEKNMEKSNCMIQQCSKNPREIPTKEPAEGETTNKPTHVIRYLRWKLGRGGLGGPGKGKMSRI